MTARKDTKKPTDRKSRSASPKKSPARTTKKSVLKAREQYLQEIGFEWNAELQFWKSPHGTCQMTRQQVEEIAAHDFPHIFDFYKKKGEFSHELFLKICEEIATSSKSTRQVCADNGIHGATFYRWLQKDQDDDGTTYGGKLRDMYARAKEDQVELLVDEMLEIADDSSDDVLRVKAVKNADGTFMHLAEENKEFVNRSKLRVDTRKFIASKLKPKKYGDKLDLTTDGEKLSQIAVFQLPSNGRDDKK